MLAGVAECDPDFCVGMTLLCSVKGGGEEEGVADVAHLDEEEPHAGESWKGSGVRDAWSALIVGGGTTAAIWGGQVGV